MAAVDDRLSRAFAALADPTRRDIIARLTAGGVREGREDPREPVVRGRC